MFKKPAFAACFRRARTLSACGLLVALGVPWAAPAAEIDWPRAGQALRVLAPAPTPAGARPDRAAVQVGDDYGGSIAAYMARVDALNASHRRVEISGDCRSACTLYLGADNLCVSQTAILRFHRPSRPRQPLTDSQFDDFSRRMASYYPDPIRNWFLNSARHETRGTVALSGAVLIQLGVPEC